MTAQERTELAALFGRLAGLTESLGLPLSVELGKIADVFERGAQKEKEQAPVTAQDIWLAEFWNWFRESDVRHCAPYPLDKQTDWLWHIAYGWFSGRRHEDRRALQLAQEVVSNWRAMTPSERQVAG